MPISVIVQLGPSPRLKKEKLGFGPKKDTKVTLKHPPPPPPPPKTVKDVPGKIEA